MDKKAYKEEVKAWKKRWEMVNEVEKEELRKTSLNEKYSQLISLMAWVPEFGWEEALEQEAKLVRERWQELYHAWKKKQ